MLDKQGLPDNNDSQAAGITLFAVRLRNYDLSVAVRYLIHYRGHS
jgi:hypothetical protein